jgi:hypothetical protein
MIAAVVIFCCVIFTRVAKRPGTPRPVPDTGTAGPSGPSA